MSTCITSVVTVSLPRFATSDELTVWRVDCFGRGPQTFVNRRQKKKKQISWDTIRSCLPQSWLGIFSHRKNIHSERTSLLSIHSFIPLSTTFTSGLTTSCVGVTAVGVVTFWQVEKLKLVLGKLVVEDQPTAKSWRINGRLYERHLNFKDN